MLLSARCWPMQGWARQLYIQLSCSQIASPAHPGLSVQSPEQCRVSMLNMLYSGRYWDSNPGALVILQVNPRHLGAAQTICSPTDSQPASQGSLQKPDAPCPRRTVSKLHDVLRPFVLRRIKADVENSLPAKQEIVLYAAQTEEQRKIDQQLRDNTLMVSSSGVVCQPYTHGRTLQQLLVSSSACPDTCPPEQAGSCLAPATALQDLALRKFISCRGGVEYGPVVL